jgi:hypothetical protein
MMGYFANGTEGMGFAENYCDKCILRVTSKYGCPIWAAHSEFNYRDCNNPKSILHWFITPGTEANGWAQTCAWFTTPGEQKALDQALDLDVDEPIQEGSRGGAMTYEPSAEAVERLSSEMFAEGFHTRSITERDNIARWWLCRIMPSGMTREDLRDVMLDPGMYPSDVVKITMHLLSILEPGEKGEGPK